MENHDKPEAVKTIEQRIKTLEQQHEWLRAENARLWDEIRSLKGPSNG